MLASMEVISQKRKTRTVPTFLKRTYELLSDDQNTEIVKWAPNGIGFVVLNEEAFAREILPKYFKHNKYTSFVRQLNMYNFHKIRQSNAESYFHHEFFDRSNQCKLFDIKRKPENKKKKEFQDQDQSSISQESISKPLQSIIKPDPIALPLLKIKRKHKKQSGDLLETKIKKEVIKRQGQDLGKTVGSEKNTNHANSTQFTVEVESQGNISVDVDSSLSINENCNEGLWLTRELIYPSYCNLFGVFYGQNRVEKFTMFH